MNEIELIESKEKTDIKLFPKLKESLTETKGYSRKLLPILSFDSGLIRPEWKGVKFKFIYHSLSISRLDFKPKEGKYELLAFEGTMKSVQDYGDIEQNQLYLKPFDGDENIEKTLLSRQYYNDKNILLTELKDPFEKTEIEYTVINSLELPIRKKNYFRIGETWNPSWDDVEYTYDDEGYLKKYKKLFEHKMLTGTEKFTYSKLKNGVKITHPRLGWCATIKEDSKYGTWDVEIKAPTKNPIP
ncbi:hypothetical protein [Spirochaeta cellobiosiphila]|uniref:hypothetical protein n=1 Tax=Spirochaeta cellobiosiphila TaxID=504483 RepID=UPI0003FE596F|nr:hypothetical protein [Spirochaeta cellobiosiphila]